MRYQLNPSFETLFLLLDPHWGKEQKRVVVEKLDELGINGVAFYAANFSIIEKYYTVFASQMVQTEGNELFKDMSDVVTLSFLVILDSEPTWLNKLDVISDKEIYTLISKTISETLECEGDIIDALQVSGISDKAKWQITALLQQPRQRLKMVFDAINANIPAFEYASAELESDISSLLEQLEEQLDTGNLFDAINQSIKVNPGARIIPSLAQPVGLIVSHTFCVFGLLVNKVYSGQDTELSSAEAVLCAKALSDASRVQILLALKDKELYNLEIAKALGITPATTSHHMSTLLSANLVIASLKDGKAYYCLNDEGIRRYRDWLDDSLL